MHPVFHEILSDSIHNDGHDWAACYAKRADNDVLMEGTQCIRYYDFGKAYVDAKAWCTNRGKIILPAYHKIFQCKLRCKTGKLN